MQDNPASLVKQMEGLINTSAPAEALQAWQAAGSPESKEFCFLVGVALERTGKAESAEAYLRRAIELDNAYAPPLRQLAALKYNLDDYAGVVEWVTRYQEFRPYDKSALGWLIFSLRELEKFTEAEEALASYAEVFPYTETTKQASMLLADARSQYLYLLLMAGRYPSEAWKESFVGTSGLAAWVNMYHTPLAQKVFNEVVYPHGAPDQDGTYANLCGDVISLAGDLSTGIRCYETARSLGFEDGKSWLNEALIRLSNGDFAGGAKAYRNRAASFKHLYLDGIQEWRGEPLAGKTLLVHSEQGCGDVIQFIRYLPYMQELDGRVIFNTYLDIMSLLKADETTMQADDVDEDVLIGQIDYQICMMDIPGYLRPNGLADFPANTPYLFPKKNKVADWHERLINYPGLKVGLVWAGNPNHHNDANRSASLAEWSALAELSGISWFALQKGSAAKETAYPPPGLALHDLSDEIKDFSDTAAILSNLDLLISVDTSVAHLAGACSIPCWTLLPNLGQDWRWRSQDEIPAWYPSMRLLKQLPSEKWDALLRRKVLPNLISMGATLAQASVATSTPDIAADALLELKAAYQQNNPQEAFTLTAAVLAKNPEHPALNLQAGLIYQKFGRLIEARAHFENVLKVSPRNLMAHRYLADLVAWKEVKKAAYHLQTALRLDLTNIQTWYHVASFYLDRHAALIAQHIAEYLLTLEDGANNKSRALLAISLWHQGEQQKAHEIIGAITDIESSDPAELGYLTVAYDYIGQRDRARTTLERLCELGPQENTPLSLPSALYLSWGEFGLGWSYYDRGRWEDPIEVPLHVPSWTREPLLDKHLLIYQDQGYGDTIQFFSLIRQLPAECMLTLSVFPELAALLVYQPLPENLRIITHAELKVDQTHYDYKIGLMHLVARSAPDLNRAPEGVPYLVAPIDRLPEWQIHCKQDPLLKIGIVWAGSPLHHNDYHRSTALEDWLPLTKLSNISLYNLQRDSASNQAYELPQMRLSERNIIYDCRDMADTAAALEMLDIVISVDSAVAHLAAAMGKETWVLLPFIGTDFRWQRDRLDCPWYPSVRLFRQQAKETWQQVLERVTLALEQRLASRP